MANYNFLDSTGLSVIKNYIDLNDAKSYKTILLDGNTIKFYKKENATKSDSADFTFTATEDADVSNLMEKLSGATTDNVVTVDIGGAVKDSGTKLTDLATKTYVAEEINRTAHLKKEIVSDLPDAEDASENVIYMVKSNSVTGDDKYSEYMKIDGEIVKIGDTSIDLSGYVRTEDMDVITPISTEAIQAIFA